MNEHNKYNDNLEAELPYKISIKPLESLYSQYDNSVKHSSNISNGLTVLEGDIPIDDLNDLIQKNIKSKDEYQKQEDKHNNVNRNNFLKSYVQETPEFQKSKKDMVEEKSKPHDRRHTEHDPQLGSEKIKSRNRRQSEHPFGNTQANQISEPSKKVHQSLRVVETPKKKLEESMSVYLAKKQLKMIQEKSKDWQFDIEKDCPRGGSPDIMNPSNYRRSENFSSNSNLLNKQHQEYDFENDNSTDPSASKKIPSKFNNSQIIILKPELNNRDLEKTDEIKKDTLFERNVSSNHNENNDRISTNNRISPIKKTQHHPKIILSQSDNNNSQQVQLPEESSDNRPLPLEQIDTYQKSQISSPGTTRIPWAYRCILVIV